MGDHTPTETDRDALFAAVDRMTFAELAGLGEMIVNALDEARRTGPRYALMLASTGQWWALRCQAGLMPQVPEAVKMTGCKTLTNEEAGRAWFDGGVLFETEYADPAEPFFAALGQGVVFQIQRGWW